MFHLQFLVERWRLGSKINYCLPTMPLQGHCEPQIQGIHMKYVIALLVAPIIISLLVLQSVTYFVSKVFPFIDRLITKTLDRVL